MLFAVKAKVIIEKEISQVIEIPDDLYQEFKDNNSMTQPFDQNIAGYLQDDLECRINDSDVLKETKELTYWELKDDGTKI